MKTVLTALAWMMMVLPPSWAAEAGASSPAAEAPGPRWAVQREKMKALGEAEKKELQAIDADAKLSSPGQRRAAKKAVRQRYRQRRQELRAQFRSGRATQAPTAPR